MPDESGNTTLWDADLDKTRWVADPEADALLVGAVDLHVHPAPSPFPRRLTLRDAVEDASSLGFKAIVAKSHHHNTQMDVLTLRDAGLADGGTDVFGSVALNHQTGGLNPYAVEISLKMGGRIVWFPTISADAHLTERPNKTFPRSSGHGLDLLDQQVIDILDEDGSVKAEAREILELIASENAILNTGHLGWQEIDVLLPAAKEAGVDRIVISHPTFIVGASAEKAGEWARTYGVAIEHCLNQLLSGKLPFDVMLEYIRHAGVGNTVLSSDLGQRNNPLPVTAYRIAVRQLLDAGFAEADITSLVATNAAGLLY